MYVCVSVYMCVCSSRARARATFDVPGLPKANWSILSHGNL